jgi:hypothetical protein
MKILNKKVHNNVAKCDCGTELEYTKEDVQTGEFGCAYIICPECQTDILLNEYCKLLTIDNVEYPKDFANFGDGKVLSDTEIQEYINKCLKPLKECTEDYGVHSLMASGDTMVFCTKHEDEYSVYVCKNYESTSIPR